MDLTAKAQRLADVARLPAEIIDADKKPAYARKFSLFAPASQALNELWKDV